MLAPTRRAAIVGQGGRFAECGDYKAWSANVEARSTGTARASGLTKCRKAQVPGGKACDLPASHARRASRCAATKARLRVTRDPKPGSLSGRSANGSNPAARGDQNARCARILK